MNVVERVDVPLPNLLSSHSGQVSEVLTASDVQSDHHLFVGELTVASHQDKALVLDQGGMLLGADLDDDLNEMLVGQDGSVRSNDSRYSHGEPFRVSEEDRLLAEDVGSGPAEIGNVKLLAHHVKINVEVKLAAHGATLIDLGVSASVDEAKHSVDVCGAVFVAEVNHV
jgi:hypothetical protein